MFSLQTLLHYTCMINQRSSSSIFCCQYVNTLRHAINNNHAAHGKIRNENVVVKI